MSEVVKLENFTKTYQTGEVEVHAVRGVNLEIQAAEFVAIMGASGSGKSTLMNTLGCLDRPTTGHYFFDGINISDLDRDELADVRNSRIGFVFQNFNLLARSTAWENVELPLIYCRPHVPLRDQRSRALEALTQVNLQDRADHMPNQLSGGQQQRVAIARALVNRPKLLLADEPTGNLDSRTSIEIMGLFQRLNELGLTVIMVTHEPDIARYCKRTVVMRDGVVVSDQPVASRMSAEKELSDWDEHQKTQLPAL
jgi:putative ABC transport system ATP-binding protein